MAIEALMYIASELGLTTLVTYDYYQSAKCLKFEHLQYDDSSDGYLPCAEDLLLVGYATIAMLDE